MAPSTPLRKSTSANHNTPTVEPWSRSTSKRFDGPESIYSKTPTATTPRGGAKTPKRTSNTTPGVDRYAAPNERADDPTPVKPNAIFASTTDRFTLPGAYVAPTAAPAVGTYNVQQAARVRGVVKLQAAVRRRQSKGIFVQLQESRITPGPLSYDPTIPAATSAGSASAAFAKPMMKQGERFMGSDSIYGSSTGAHAMPGVGAYNPALPAVGEVPAEGPSACFRGEEDRFATVGSIYTPSVSSDEREAVMGSTPAGDEVRSGLSKGSAAFAPTSLGRMPDRFTGHGTIYHATAAAATPGAGEYDGHGPVVAIKPTSSASFASTTDRFQLPSSHVAVSAAPGVGTYTPTTVSAIALPHQDSTFASSTDRFQLPGSHVQLTDAPAVGTYRVSNADKILAERVRGAVKLQAAVRRRQSRGLFAQLEEEAKDTPGPDQYAPALLPDLAQAVVPKVRPTQPVASVVSAADAPQTVAPPAPPALPPLPTVLGTLAEEATPEEAAALIPCVVVEPARVAMSAHLTLDERLAAMDLSSPPALVDDVCAVPFETDAEVLAASPVVRDPPVGMRLSRVVSLDIWLAEEDDDEHENDDCNVAAVGVAPLTAAAPAKPILARSGSTTPWGPLDDDDGPSERLSLASVMSDAADGDWLFSQLIRMVSDTEVDRSDYYSEEDGWDLDGLREDLQLYMKQSLAVDIV